MTEGRSAAQVSTRTPGDMHTPVSRPVLPLRTSLPLVLGIAVLAGPVAVFTWSPRTGMSEISAFHCVAFTAFTLVWDRIDGVRSREGWAVAAAVWTALVAGQLLVGYGPLEAAITSGGGIVSGLVAAVVVSWAAAGEPSWYPRTPVEVAILLGACAVAAPVGLALGAYHGGVLGGTGRLGTDLWGGVRGFVVMAVTAASVLPLFHTPAVTRTHTPSTRTLLLLPLVVAACLAPSFLLPAAMLGWLVLVPAVWAGMSLPPRPVAVTTLVIALVMSAAPYPEHLRSGSPIPPEMGIDLMLVCVSLAALHIVVLRERTAQIREASETRARAERERTSFLTGVLDRMGDGLLLTDRDGRVLRSNPAARQVIGDRPVLDLDWVQQVQLQSADVGRILGAADIRRILEPTSAFRHTDLVLPDSGGGARRLRLASRDLGMTERELVLMFVKDTTAEHARQHELESFAGTVAHDLKSPLTGLRGWIEAAVEEVDDGDGASARVAVRRARDATSRMSDLIDDMLAYTVTQEGVLHSEDVALADVAAALAELYSGGRASGATFVVDAPHVVHADPALTRQLLANLIGNAIKYSRPGEPPYIEICSYDGEPGWVEVAVSDKGRGLEPGDEERIFAAFGRSDKDASSVQGIGLGLSLCHAIVTRHGGRIGAEGNEWGGATFMFLLPAAS